MEPLALILNIALIVGMVGIVVYWVRRFAVFRGYTAIQPDVLRIAELLKSQPLRDGSDVVIAGTYGRFPTIIRFSNKVDTPGLDIVMRVPATLQLSLLPKSVLPKSVLLKTVPAGSEGAVVVRTGSALLDRRFNARTGHPAECKMLFAGQAARASLEQLCCSTQTSFSIAERAMELTELTVPAFTATHVFDHLQAMLILANYLFEMPGASQIKVEALPRQGSSWPIRAALAGGLACLIALLFLQPYSHTRVTANAVVHPWSGILPADAARLQQLQGWRVATTEDFSPSGLRFLRENQLEASGHIRADFAGRGRPLDSAYLLVNGSGRKRISMLAEGMLAYDAVFDQADALARVPKNNVAKIQWIASAPQFVPEGDALLIIQNANDPSTGLVVLKHGTQTHSARPADFTKIDLVSE